MTKYVCYVTPKAFDKLNLPAQYADTEIIVTTLIYMNLANNTWTEDMCDSVAYIVERSSFNQNQLMFRKSNET